MTPQQRQRVDRGLGLVCIGFLFFASADLLRGVGSVEDWIKVAIFGPGTVFFLRDLLRERTDDKLVSRAPSEAANEGQDSSHVG